MNTEPQAGNATPHETLIGRILDSRIPKNEEGWAAGREIERLRAELAEKHDTMVAGLKQDAQTIASLKARCFDLEAEVARLTAALNGKENSDG